MTPFLFVLISIKYFIKHLICWEHVQICREKVYIPIKMGELVGWDIHFWWFSSRYVNQSTCLALQNDSNYKNTRTINEKSWKENSNAKSLIKKLWKWNCVIFFLFAHKSNCVNIVSLSRWLWHGTVRNGERHDGKFRIASPIYSAQQRVNR